MEKDLEIRKLYAQWKEKASYYFDKILITLSAWWFVFSLKFTTSTTITNTLKYSWLCFLIAILSITISYYFSEKSYEKTFEEYEKTSDKNICKKCNKKITSELTIYNFLIEALKIIWLLAFIWWLILILIHYRKQ
jgi:hypothetical protein